MSDADALGIALADDVLVMPDRKRRDRMREERKNTLQEILRDRADRANRQGEGND
ncbi:hypothetical protein [Bradyrhizobium sp. LTSPM299]|uniref:hypothetical protein n=1 Tax=Bradyrhizobium sp. LTSPM299 TaxID=1619233 RepID=UPI0012E0D727|nr:hypothetical protein [Bradyrhizobium sp. LTSPM299]